MCETLGRQTFNSLSAVCLKSMPDKTANSSIMIFSNLTYFLTAGDQIK